MELRKGPVYAFIASSSEGLNIAEDIHANLDKYKNDEHKLCCAELWDDVFLPSDIVIDRLLEESETYDYAIFVITPDDLVESRGNTQMAPRDNINFEIGLFMAKLGRKHCIIVRPDEQNIKLPSDLNGICCIRYTFDPKHPTNSDLRPVTTTIRQYIEKTGYRDFKSSFMTSWGYGKKEKTFAIDIDINSLTPYKNGNFSLLLGCFSNDDSSVVFETEEIALSKCWNIPTNLPREASLYVDCASFSEKLEDNDTVWGVLFLIRGKIELSEVQSLGDIVQLGGRVLEGRGNVVNG